MKKYQDYQEDKTKEFISSEELKKVQWLKYKIIVPSKEDKEETMEAFSHFHYSNIDTEFVAVNQLAHEYLDGSNIIVNKKLYDKLLEKYPKS